MGLIVGRAVNILGDEIADGEIEPDAFRNYAYGIAAFVGVLAASATLFFQPIRLWLNERSAQTAEQGMITDRINKAVEGLGAERVIKRQRTDKEGHLTYQKNDTGETDPLPDDFGTGDIDRGEMQQLAMTTRTEWSKWRAQIRQPDDIRVALEILSDRSARQRAIERRNTTAPPDIHTFEKHAAPALTTALSKESTELRSAVHDALTRWKQALSNSRHFRLDLRNADLRGADLSNLTLELCRFEGTQLQGAELRGAKLQGAILWGAALKSTDLTRCRMDRTRERVRSVDFTQPTTFPMEMLSYMFGVKAGAEKVTLPNGVTDYPDH